MRIGVIGTKWGLMHVGAFRAASVEDAARVQGLLSAAMASEDGGRRIPYHLPPHL